MRNEDEKVLRIIQLKGKPVSMEITIQHQGYLLSISLVKKDKSFMKNIVEVLGKYGFESLLVNFQVHKTFKSSPDPDKYKATQLLNEICGDLENKFGKKNKFGILSFRKKENSKQTEKIGKSDHSPMAGKISNEPPKVEPKHKREFILTGEGPLTDVYPVFGKEKPQKTIDSSTKGLYTDSKEVQRKQQVERERRRQEDQYKPGRETTREFDPYLVLGLNRNASCEEVKARFKELIKKNSFSGIINMTPEEQERKEGIVRNIIKAKDMIYKEKGCTN